MTGLGYERDPADDRDKSVEELGLAATPPSSTDWEHAKTCVREILSQRQEPACVGYSVAGALRTSLALDALPDYEPSPRAIWFWARSSEGREDENSGTHVRAAMRACTDLGVVPLSMYGRDIPHTKAPSFGAQRAAHKWRGVRGYYRATTLDQIKRALASHSPVVFGMDVYSEWQAYQGGTIERWRGERLGGHATYLIGYDDGRLLGVNSYSSSWGDSGFYWIAEELFEAERRDCWVADLNRSAAS